MHRRSLLRLLGAAGVALPWMPSLARSQAAPLSLDAVAILRAVAGAVLPSTIDARGADAVVDSFLAWLRGYRSGADMGFGYGIVRHRVTPVIVPATYVEQLASLDRAAGGKLARLTLEARQNVLRSALDAAGIQDLPSAPTGAHVVSDFMSHYYNSPDANDLCYQARIGRDSCRTLAGSSRRPDPLTKR
jgi:hypothetical protein